MTSRNQAESSENSTQTANIPKQKGIVLCCPTIVDGHQLSMPGQVCIDPQELRCATLLWDKAAWPDNNIVGIADDPDTSFLREIGFLTRPDVRVEMNGSMAELFVAAHLKGFQQLEESEPGAWSLAQGATALMIRNGVVIEAGNAQLTLTNAIPVPDKDVPLAEVLEFKERRKDELTLMRQNIDELLVQAGMADNPEDGLREAVALVDNACADAIRVGAEWQFPVRLTNLKTSYKVRPFQTLAGALTGAFGGQIAHLSTSQAVLAGLAGAAAATAPMLEFSFDGFDWRGLRPRQGPYRYVYSFHRELF